MIFVYYYQADSTKEAIGRVQASSMDEARELVALSKKIDVKLIDELFVIESIDRHENSI